MSKSNNVKGAHKKLNKQVRSVSARLAREKREKELKKFRKTYDITKDSTNLVNLLSMELPKIGIKLYVLDKIIQLLNSKNDESLTEEITSITELKDKIKNTEERMKSAIDILDKNKGKLTVESTFAIINTFTDDLFVMLEDYELLHKQYIDVLTKYKDDVQPIIDQEFKSYQENNISLDETMDDDREINEVSEQNEQEEQPGSTESENS